MSETPQTRRDPEVYRRPLFVAQCLTIIALSLNLIGGEVARCLEDRSEENRKNALKVPCDQGQNDLIKAAINEAKARAQSLDRFCLTHGTAPICELSPSVGKALSIAEGTTYFCPNEIKVPETALAEVLSPANDDKNAEVALSRGFFENPAKDLIILHEAFHSARQEGDTQAFQQDLGRLVRVQTLLADGLITPAPVVP